MKIKIIILILILLISGNVWAQQFNANVGSPANLAGQNIVACGRETVGSIRNNTYQVQGLECHSTSTCTLDRLTQNYAFTANNDEQCDNQLDVVSQCLAQQIAAGVTNDHSLPAVLRICFDQLASMNKGDWICGDSRIQNVGRCPQLPDVSIPMTRATIPVGTMYEAACVPYPGSPKNEYMCEYHKVAGSCLADSMCDDGNDCTSDICNRDSFSCTNTNENIDDGNRCTTDACGPGGVTHEPIQLPRNNDVCVSLSCDPAKGIIRTPLAKPNVDKCHTVANVCDPIKGWVVSSVPVDDGNACTTDSCDPARGVIHTPINSRVCNPQPQNDVDLCFNVTVDDGNACTADSCDPARGVIHTPINSRVCNPQPQNDVDLCYNNPLLDDNDYCTVDSCDPRTGAVSHVRADTPACRPQNDVDLCFNVTVDDGNACTTDSCDPARGVIHTPIHSRECGQPNDGVVLCGNGTVDRGEVCDDGANNGTPGHCNSTCTEKAQEAQCGNNALEDGEKCDDGNTTDGDGCSAKCEIEKTQCLVTCEPTQNDKELNCTVAPKASAPIVNPNNSIPARQISKSNSIIMQSNIMQSLAVRNISYACWKLDANGRKVSLPQSVLARKVAFLWSEPGSNESIYCQIISAGQESDICSYMNPEPQRQCQDKDGDNQTDCDGDCDDNDPNVGSLGKEEICDGIDNNCNGLIDENISSEPIKCAVEPGCELSGQKMCKNGAMVDVCPEASNCTPNEPEAVTPVPEEKSGELQPEVQAEGAPVEAPAETPSSNSSDTVSSDECTQQGGTIVTLTVQEVLAAREGHYIDENGDPLITAPNGSFTSKCLRASGGVEFTGGGCSLMVR